MRSPLEITEEGEYWLRSRDVSDSSTVGGEAYFAEHDVTPAEELTAEDLPPAETEAVRELDREALDRELTIGKWQVTGSAERVDELWPKLVADAEAGTIWAVKAMTGFGYEALSVYDDYVLTVYTPNYFDRDDVGRVRDHLRDEHRVTHKLCYKPDIYTKKGVVAESAGEFGLSRPARYVE
ncbi:putative phosphothreonine lyase domain-containing protein [Halomarina litorea]|uniref:putative phosphothreonine lyase domain-containing protein n=1 Tax=Halomarina litorea TaxID=2961595 RepID=UPI0020C4ADC3|nr:putative phosphothreonine lyase domain-containg protein [Halomarina sp. BCD28]